MSQRPLTLLSIYTRMSSVIRTYGNIVSHDAQKLVRSVLASISPIGIRSQDLFQRIHDQFPSERTPVHAAHAHQIHVSPLSKGKGKGSKTIPVVTDPESQLELHWHPVSTITYLKQVVLPHMWESGEIEKIHLRRGGLSETGQRMDTIKVVPIKTKGKAKKPGFKVKKVALTGGTRLPSHKETHPGIPILDSVAEMWHWRLSSTGHKLINATSASVDQDQPPEKGSVIPRPTEDSTNRNEVISAERPERRNNFHPRGHSAYHWQSDDSNLLPHLRSRSLRGRDFKRPSNNHLENDQDTNIAQPGEPSRRPDRIYWPKWPESTH